MKPSRSAMPSNKPVVITALTALMAAGGCSTKHSATRDASAGAPKVARPVHWAYTGHEGPRHWGSLDPAYAACDRGHSQSPVDITKTGPGTGKTWKLNYTSTSLRIAHHEHDVDIVDNGHTIQVTVDEGSTLTTERGTYHLKQFHYHTPSEHTVDGKHFPMEVHFVHQSDDGHFAVVGAFFEQGKTNPNLEQLIAHFPKAKGDAQHFTDKKLDLAFHLPPTTEAYTYLGSFTTPPCTENVEWLVLRDPVSASREQLKAFAERLHHNNRPIQPLHGRPVGTSAIAGATTR